MDASPSALAKLLIPQIPSIFKTALFHSLWLSPTSSKWDLRTEITINVLRTLLSGKPSPLKKMQRASMKDPGVKGPMWVSKTSTPVPTEDDVRQILFKAIEEMKDGPETYTPPELVPVEAEWNGYRANVAKDAPEPSISEAEKYASMMKDVKSDVTILYFHGGAHYLMDPCTHRVFCSRLARISGGRVYSVRYRLAPQNPFPAALLDAFIAYLTLLYPPEGSLHEPVQASHIVFGGDSAGGNLSFALLQLLLQLRRSAGGSTPTVTFNGKQVEIPLPAGVSGNAPWLDITRSMPSLQSNAKYDYLPPPSESAMDAIPHDEIWPASPPREDVYCNGSMLCHPLASPLSATDWSGSPPLFFGLGEEMLADEDKVVASRAVKQGVKVHWEQYEAMCHCFAMMLEGLDSGKMFFTSWGKWCREAVDRPTEMKTEGWFVTAKKLDRKPVDMEALSTWTDEEVSEKMKDARNKRLKGQEKEGKALPRL
ncbi:hypothetical protein K402DRAFT_331297 [Aulographum hederae CBS 113979]|uniref:Alpha/beta hydrolase fold-3 domain-containing protein n=1 Tax=Aulographum hederae CBS 113979 TaxID=1176131 RepID=A0A6G1H1P6_9PEZI|nr:hypothetical protein K402DRAFT_331297 [Aulographum hederae CBS 113979]